MTQCRYNQTYPSRNPSVPDPASGLPMSNVLSAKSGFRSFSQRMLKRSFVLCVGTDGPLSLYPSLGISL